MNKAKILSAMALATMVLLCSTGCGMSSLDDAEIAEEVTNTTTEENEASTTATTTEVTTETTTTTKAIEYECSNVLIGYAEPTSLSKYLQLLCMQESELDAILGMEGQEWEEIYTLEDLYNAVNANELLQGHHLMYEGRLELEDVIQLFKEKKCKPMIVNNQMVAEEDFILKGGDYSADDPNYFSEFIIYDRTSNGKSESYYEFLVNHAKPVLTKLEPSENSLEIEYYSEYRFEVLWLENGGIQQDTIK